MNLSVVIVNYRSWDCLERCLERLASEAENEPWEIVVVDNHSADGRLASFRARFGGVRFEESPVNGGFANGCNRGASCSTGDVLLFMNPDVVPEQGSIQALLESRRAARHVAILSASQVDAQGRLRKMFDVFPNRMTWFRTAKTVLRLVNPGRYPDPRRPFTGLLECDWVSGSVFMIGRDAFEQLGGWREDYWMYVEDCDFCLRAHRAGMKVAVDGDVRMMHAHGGASRQSFEISVLTRTEAAISKHLFVQLNYQGLNRAVNHLCVFLAVVPKLLLFTALDWLSLRQTVTLRTRSGVLAGLLAHYGRVMRTRDWRSARVAGD